MKKRVVINVDGLPPRGLVDQFLAQRAIWFWNFGSAVEVFTVQARRKN